MKDVIVLLPGITGSVLEKDGRVVWGFSPGSIVGALVTRGASLKKALLLSDDPPDQDDLGDGIQATRLVPDLHLLPGLWKIDGYTRVSRRIRAAFETTPGENYFEFPYDWRRTNVVAARKLKHQAHTWLKQWREKTQEPDAKLILVAHSMGGLVARYFLEVLEGWRDTRALVTFGTPYRGSLNAVGTLVNGLQKGPLGLFDLTDLARSFTAIHELLPIYPCYDAGNGRLERIAEATGVPNIDTSRAAAALAFHRSIEQAVNQNLKDGAYRDHRYALQPIVGLQQETFQSAVLEGSGVRLLRTREGRDESGDGTVPRVSATPIEYSNSHLEVFTATQHGSLQNADTALLNLEGFIAGLSLHLGAVKRDQRTEPENVRVSIEVEDLRFENEPVEVRARPSREGTELTASLIDGSGAIVAKETMRPASDGWCAVTFSSLPSGAYRARVDGEKVESATDAFAVGPSP